MIRLLDTLALVCWRTGDLLGRLPRRLDRLGNAAAEAADTLRSLEAEVERLVKEYA